MASHPRRTQLDYERLHEQIAARLMANGQRYTSGRSQLVELLASADQPIDMPVIVREIPDVPQSSAYRTLATFTMLGITRRISTDGDGGHFELGEEFAGVHHHHALCRTCGKVVDIDSSPKLEKALTEAAKLASQQSGFELDAHRIELVGSCYDCR